MEGLDRQDWEAMDPAEGSPHALNFGCHHALQIIRLAFGALSVISQ